MKIDESVILRLASATLRVGMVACLAVGLIYGQQSGLQFEVTSVRPMAFPNDAFAAGFRAGAASNPCGGGKLSVSGTLVSLTAAGICDIIRMAYDVKNYQVVAVPATLGFSGQDRPAPISIQAAMAEAASAPTFFYDIEARAPGAGPPNDDQVREMLRALLADRFRLTLHRETRDFAYYALVPAKNGPKLTPAVEGCKPHGGPGLMAACGVTMEQIAKRLNAYTDRTVMDMTGISGKFDYEIPMELGDGDFRSTALASILDHLKLKLEPRKGPVEVLVVDHVEKPSEN